MSGKVFLDTNILVYTYSNSEPIKQATARNLVINSYSFISTQVLQELVNTVTRKFKFTYADAVTAIDECSIDNFVHINTPDTINRACTIAQRYDFTFYDCLIIAAALECGCSILYSEDMANKQVINGTLTIVNPFVV
jgi:predicted nucleic acid-binding protein